MIGITNANLKRRTNNFLSVAEDIIFNEKLSDVKDKCYLAKTDVHNEGVLVIISDMVALVDCEDEVFVDGGITFLPSFVRSIDDAKSYLKTAQRVYEKAFVDGGNATKRAFVDLMQIKDD